MSCSITNYNLMFSHVYALLKSCYDNCFTTFCCLCCDNFKRAKYEIEIVCEPVGSHQQYFGSIFIYQHYQGFPPFPRVLYDK